jgi:CMP-N,N'-diacetyllegionaminic acid synthase
VSRLCTICARGGSKGVPDKNIRLLAGKPLVAWSVLQARATGLFDWIAVSSDSEAILQAGEAAGADQTIRRPDELATDEAGKVPAIRHAVAAAEEKTSRTFDILVDLDATAPLRLPRDIAAAVELLETSGAASVITGCEARRSPYFNLVEAKANGRIAVAKRAKSVLRRQDAPRSFDMNASIYVWRRARFMADPRVFYASTRLHEMSAERSHDIDTELDFEIVAFLFDRLGIAAALPASRSAA